ncbi:ABC transporter substrate-binding protein [Microbacterium karelineae]|uniref:ABC transporter substrate-binding protein n=1 Tax=Microbacterium karelineae TaxID=2654283 RepID=UPI001E45EE52|nr:ABC transporter substrate-binding protein [Microbacterium karelineae]
MSTRALRKTAVGIAATAAGALALAGCSPAADGSDGSGSGSDEDITLTITTFGTFGYDGLYEEYEAANPNVTIEATNIDTGGNARTDLFTKLAAGSGASDIVAIEEGWIGAVMEVSTEFVDLTEHGIADRKDDWVPWKYDGATDPDGRVIGYGTDVGPAGICYNKPAFEAAGLPTDRDEVAELLEGDWAHYFEVGQQYTDASDKAWFDQSGFVWNSMVNQLAEGYYTADGELNIDGNSELRERFDLLAAAVEGGQSAAQTEWDWNGGRSFVDGTFATYVCPGWMLGVVQGQIEAGGGDADTGWDFADVFPGGAGNWGGAWLSIPESSMHKEAAAELADWLTQPEQQVKQATAAGNFPSTVEAQETLAADATPNEFFGGAPTGAILAERAKGVQAQFKGPDDSVIQENVFGPALDKLDRGEADADEAWDEALGLLGDLVE